MVEEKPLNTGKSRRDGLIKMSRRPHNGARLDSSRGETQAALVAQLGAKMGVAPASCENRSEIFYHKAMRPGLGVECNHTSTV